MWRALLFLLCLTAGSRQVSITELLVPPALEAGEDAHLECKYDLLKNESEKNLYVKWWWTPLDNTDGERYQLYQRIAGHKAETIQHHHNHVEIDENDGIKLLNVSPAVSGIYECEVSNVDEDRQHKKMIVFSIGSGPMLNVTGDEQAGVLVTCEAIDLAPRPDITITLNGEKVESSGYVNELEDGLYEIYENATLSLNEADNGDFRCEVFFEDNDFPHSPYVASQMFTAPTVSTTEIDEAATEPPAAARETYDNGCDKFGDSWILLTSFSLVIHLLHHYNK